MSTCGAVTTGLVSGLLLIGSLANSGVGLPILAAFLLAGAAGLSFRGADLPIAGLLTLKAAWVSLIALMLDDVAPQALLHLVGTDLILLVAFALRTRAGFIEGLSEPLLWLAAVDFAFNASSVLTGADLLGRVGSSRPDDIIPRLGGVIGHPFYSINISILGILLAWCFSKRALLALSIVNILINGSYRGWVTLVTLAAISILIVRGARLRTLLAAATCIAASVILATYLSVKADDFWSGNYFRVFAWGRAVEVSLDNPLTGFHGFVKDELLAVSEEDITAHGIAESTYLGYSSRFGLLPMLAHVALITYVFAKRVHLLRRGTRGVRINTMAAAFAGLAYVDTFYGTLLGSVLTTTTYGLICLSARGEDDDAIGDVSDAGPPSERIDVARPNSQHFS